MVEIRAAGGPEWLPDHGKLLFFYELEQGSWGLAARDVGSAVVLRAVGSQSAAVEPTDLPEEAKFPAYPIAFARTVSFPTEERVGIDWASLTTASSEALEQALVDLAPDPPMHQIGGYPCPVQSDQMEASCHDIAKRVGQHGGGVAEWRLLLQLDTDDEAGVIWGM